MPTSRSSQRSGVTKKRAVRTRSLGQRLAEDAVRSALVDFGAPTAAGQLTAWQRTGVAKRVSKAFSGLGVIRLDPSAVTVNGLVNSLADEVSRLVERAGHGLVRIQLYQCSGARVHYFRSRGTGRCRFDDSELKAIR